MNIKLRNNTFKATQWFKDGDHPAVKLVEHVSNHYPEQQYNSYEINSFDIYKKPITIKPGMWIVEMFCGIYVCDSDKFKKLFVIEIEDNPNDLLIEIVNEVNRLKAESIR